MEGRRKLAFLFFNQLPQFTLRGLDPRILFWAGKKDARVKPGRGERLEAYAGRRLRASEDLESGIPAFAGMTAERDGNAEKGSPGQARR
jgi:hypothetical protein